MVDKLEQMMINEGWTPGYYTNWGVKYFSFRKNGFEIDWKDINETHEEIESKHFKPWKEDKSDKFAILGADE